MDISAPIVQYVVALALGPLAFVGTEIVKALPKWLPFLASFLRKKRTRQIVALVLSVGVAVLFSAVSGALAWEHAMQVGLLSLIAAFGAWLTHKLRNANEAADARP